MCSSLITWRSLRRIDRIASGPCLRHATGKALASPISMIGQDTYKLRQRPPVSRVRTPPSADVGRVLLIAQDSMRGDDNASSQRTRVVCRKGERILEAPPRPPGARLTRTWIRTTADAPASVPQPPALDRPAVEQFSAPLESDDIAGDTRGPSRRLGLSRLACAYPKIGYTGTSHRRLRSQFS